MSHERSERRSVGGSHARRNGTGAGGRPETSAVSVGSEPHLANPGGHVARATIFPGAEPQRNEPQSLLAEIAISASINSKSNSPSRGSSWFHARGAKTLFSPRPSIRSKASRMAHELLLDELWSSPPRTRNGLPVTTNSSLPALSRVTDALDCRIVGGVPNVAEYQRTSDGWCASRRAAEPIELEFRNALQGV